MWHGVDEYFLDFDEDSKEKKIHYQYFESKKFIKKIGAPKKENYSKNKFNQKCNFLTYFCAKSEFDKPP